MHEESGFKIVEAVCETGAVVNVGHEYGGLCFREMQYFKGLGSTWFGKDERARPGVNEMDYPCIRIVYVFPYRGMGESNSWMATDLLDTSLFRPISSFCKGLMFYRHFRRRVSSKSRIWLSNMIYVSYNQTVPRPVKSLGAYNISWNNLQLNCRDWRSTRYLHEVRESRPFA